jgi:hypothetical protein
VSEKWNEKFARATPRRRDERARATDTLSDRLLADVFEMRTLQVTRRSFYCARDVRRRLR